MVLFVLVCLTCVGCGDSEEEKAKAQRLANEIANVKQQMEATKSELKREEEKQGGFRSFFSDTKKVDSLQKQVADLEEEIEFLHNELNESNESIWDKIVMYVVIFFLLGGGALLAGVFLQG